MASQELSPADRIRELSAINADIPVMLESAAKAINTLTNRPLTKSGDDGDDTTMENGDNATTMDQRKEAFTEHTKAYYTTLQAIVARLRRQAYALEEAGIIAADAPNALVSGGSRGQSGAAPSKESEKITNGGLGNLDIGWLNSRGNKVGAEKENELVEAAKKLLEETLSRDRSTENETVKLPERLPEAFNTYSSWLYTGAIHSNYSIDDSADDGAHVEKYHRLTIAYVLGEYLQDARFKDAIMDSLLSKLRSDTGSTFFLTGPELVKMVSDGTTAPSPARLLMADLFAIPLEDLAITFASKTYSQSFTDIKYDVAKYHH